MSEHVSLPGALGFFIAAFAIVQSFELSFISVQLLKLLSPLKLKGFSSSLIGTCSLLGDHKLVLLLHHESPLVCLCGRVLLVNSVNSLRRIDIMPGEKHLLLGG